VLFTKKRFYARREIVALCSIRKRFVANLRIIQILHGYKVYVYNDQM